MGRLLNIITPLHTRTARDYAARMADDKVHCSEVARQYGAEYWDGPSSRMVMVYEYAKAILSGKRPKDLTDHKTLVLKPDKSRRSSAVRRQPTRRRAARAGRR